MGREGQRELSAQVAWLQSRVQTLEPVSCAASALSLSLCLGNIPWIMASLPFLVSVDYNSPIKPLTSTLNNSVG